MYGGKFAFQNEWTSLTVGRTFTVFALVERNFLYLEGRFNGGFFALRVSGAYIWRGLYMEGLIFGILGYVQTDLTTANNVRICRPTMLRPFAQGFTFNTVSIPLAGYSLEAISVS